MTQKVTQDYRTEMRVLLLRTGLSQVELAARLGVCREYLSRVINGHKAGHPLRARLVREYGWPQWVLDGPRRKKAA